MSTSHRAWIRAGTVVMGIGLLSGSVCLPHGVSAYEYEEGETQAAAPPHSTSRTAPKTSSENQQRTEIEKKLNEILKQQTQILQKFDAIEQRFDAVMEELRIIKIRATLRGGS